VIELVFAGYKITSIQKKKFRDKLGTFGINTITDY